MSLDQPLPDVKPLSATKDGFLDGRLTIEQPKKGFRAGLDSVLLGASVSRARGARRLADFGAGAGVAGLVALHHDPKLRAVFLESDPGMRALCERNIAANAFPHRASVIEADVTRPWGRDAEGRFDVVIANPPFHDPARATVSPLARHANAQDPALLGAWVATAARALRKGGEAIFIHHAASLAPLLEAFARHFGGIDILPLAPYPGAPAIRVLMRGVKGSAAPLTLLAPAAIHGETGGAFTDAVEDVLRGRALFHWNRAAPAPR